MAGGHVLCNVGRASSVSEGAKVLSGVLKNGGALEKFKAVIKAQGVAAADADALCAKNADVFSVLSRSAHTTPVTSPDTGMSFNSTPCYEFNPNIVVIVSLLLAFFVSILQLQQDASPNLQVNLSEIADLKHPHLYIEIKFTIVPLRCCYLNIRSLTAACWYQKRCIDR
jgi:hypothetical protein